jgi:hypothetical protein
MKENKNNRFTSALGYPNIYNPQTELPNQDEKWKIKWTKPAQSKW